VTRNDATECSPWFPPPGTPAGSALPSSGSAEMRSPASTVLWRRPTPCAPLAVLGCLRPAIPCGASVGSLPAVQTRGRGPGVRRPVPTSGECPQGGSQGLSGSRAIHCPYALFFDPGRTEHARPLRRVGVAPAMSTAKAPARFQLSRLNRTALGLAVYASPGAVTRTRRKTRFRPLAKRYRTGLVTRRVPSKGFRIASCDSSSFPKLSWRKAIQGCSPAGLQSSAAARCEPAASGGFYKSRVSHAAHAASPARGRMRHLPTTRIVNVPGTGAAFLPWAGSLNWAVDR